MNHPKRLIEVDLLIKRISAHARREKSIRHGHISTLHIWWARRPLAACRAVICASLWIDPADPLCPESFRKVARNWMRKWATDYIGLLGSESYTRFVKIQKNPSLLEDNEELRQALLGFIADFANWDNSTKKEYLETSRALTQTAHEALGGAPGTKPLVVDPFAGGGAIPLEALRVGADAFASDLNPVAVLLNKVVLEYIPKYGQRLADEIREWGEWVKREAVKELAEFYPPDPDGAIPIAYLWARTITCEGPGCGTEVPLIRSLWLSKKVNRGTALRIIPNRKAKRVDFEIIENTKAKDVAEGTVKHSSATCPVCGFTTPVTSVRRQIKERRGGAADARLYCVVTKRPSQQGRFYRLPTDDDIETAQRAKVELSRHKNLHTESLPPIPDEPIPKGSSRIGGGSPFTVFIYGMEKWGDLFTPRQALALTTLTRLVRGLGKEMSSQLEPGLAMAVQTCLALAVDKQADLGNSLNRWEPIAQCPRQLFGRQAIAMIWDFAEGVPLGDSSGSFEVFVKGIVNALHKVGWDWSLGTVEMASASNHPLPDDTANALITDPPYYDAVPYADLSDFFYVWLKRTLPVTVSDNFSTALTPKVDECIVDGAREKDKAYFEHAMSQAMAEGRRLLHPSGVGIVVFAHKSTVGWEAQLQAMVDAGWTITGSWPIDTENASRLRAQDSAVLASSIHLVCRPRENADGTLYELIGDWRDVLQELPRRIHEWMPRLCEEGIVGADAIFACLGPALEVFSRYSSVEKASGEQVSLKEYLEYVWAAVAKEALNMIFEGADATGFEEDARLTAMWLWTLSTAIVNGDESATADNEETDETDEKSKSKAGKSSGFSLEYDTARKIAQGLGASLETLTGIVEITGNTARLLSVSERTPYLFPRHESQAPTRQKKKSAQPRLFEGFGKDEEGDGSWGDKTAPKLGDTVLDHVHQSMILFAAGRGEALKRFLVEEGAGNNPQFWRLAQAFSALYPSGGEEKRWVDGVLARKKSLGF